MLDTVQPDRPGNYLGEILGDYLWVGDKGGWESVYLEQKPALLHL
jgi:hypothetical protein